MQKVSRQKRPHRKERNWQNVKKILEENVLKKQGKLLASSRKWFKRYLAAQCYHLGDNIADEKVFLNLLEDGTILIAVNAMLLIFTHPSSFTVNRVIDVFSEARRQKILANLLANQPNKNVNFIAEIIIERVKIEKNSYARLLCYRILTILNTSYTMIDIAKNDLSSKKSEIKIAAIYYLFHVDYQQSKNRLLNYINDPNQEVRAVVAKELGNTRDESAIPYLESHLSDSAWWVRMNTANALINIGEKGIVALEKAKNGNDKFASETAFAILEIYKKGKV